MRMLVLAVLAGSGLLAPPARGQDTTVEPGLEEAREPLLLRIRPNRDEAIAARARALRDEVWARSDRRARIVIASVCTGCMKPLAPPPTARGPAAAAEVTKTGSATDPSHVSSIAGDP